MRTIKQVHRRKLPIAIVDEQGEVVGAELKEEATYHVVAFGWDISHVNGGKVSGMVAQGFLRDDGSFEYQPGAVSQFHLMNNPDLEVPMTTLADFIVWCGGNIMEDVTPQKFLDYITDVLCLLPKAEMTPGTPAHELQERGFFDRRDWNYTIEEMRLSKDKEHQNVLLEWEQKKGTKAEMLSLLTQRGLKPYKPEKGEIIQVMRETPK